MKPPNYRDASNPRFSCKTCAYFRDAGSWCEMFSVAVKAEKTCSKWTETRSEVPMPEKRRTVSTAEREKLASKGQAMPDGSYPIANVGDLKNAIQAIGRAKNPGAVKAHIKRRAKALGRSDLIPDDWRTAQMNLDTRDFEPGEPDADDFGGPSDGDGDQGEEGDCLLCNGTGKTDLGKCPGCEGTGKATIEGLVGGQPFSVNSASARLKGTTERRSFTTEGAELRSTADGGLRFSGYASITETPYEVAGFEETFARGAFKRCLNDNPDVCLLINHEGLPLARTSSGTLTLVEDSRGLKVQADLDPADPDVASLAPKMRRGDLTEMSFAFRALEDEWSDNDSKRLVRSATIHRGDVSVVTRGANSNTTASIRAVIEEMEQRGDKPEAIRDELVRIKHEVEERLVEDAPVIVPIAGTPAQDRFRDQLELARAKRRRLG